MKLSQEKRAVKIVKQFEKKRTHKEPQEMPNGYGYDVKSIDRYIEVKGRGTDIKRPVWVSLHHSLFKKAWKWSKKYYVYLVYNMNDKPKMKIIPPEKIFPNLRIEPKYVLDGKYIRDKEIKEIDVSKFAKTRR